MSSSRVDSSAGYFRSLQTSICSALEQADGKATFAEDIWEHSSGGGGQTRIIRNGGVFEKGAVNFSRVSSPLSDEGAARMHTSPQRIEATGISLIVHPHNPFVPTVHANFRYLELENGDWWFGGGADLTPYYLFDEDARHFHAAWKRACDAHNEAFYGKFKAWCDRYFFLPHRNEARGIGGIFFDNLSGGFDALFRFVRSCGSSCIDAYLPIVQRRRDTPYGEEHRLWQLQRRGRYAEFNLVYDRGTKFGLDTGGRIESILASLPPIARWDYDVRVPSGSEEERLIDVLKSPRDWA